MPSHQPDEVLIDALPNRPVLPVCDHYAGNPKFYEKALAVRQRLGPVLDITLDLEDGAKVGEEAQAARWAQEQLQNFPWDSRGLGVRIHAVDHPAFKDDLNTLLASPSKQLSYLMLPKAGACEDVQHAIFEIEYRCQQNGWETPPPLHVLIETPGAVLDVEKIAGLMRVQSLSFGVMDFVSHFNGAITDDAMRSPRQFEHPILVNARVGISMACHRFGKVPSHNVCTQFKDLYAVTADAQRARRDFGFLRMWSIHPAQIEPIISAFAPSDTALAQAAQILLKAQDNNWGPIEFEGVLHDRASLRYYWSVLKQARLTGTALPAGTHTWFEKSPS